MPRRPDCLCGAPICRSGRPACFRCQQCLDRIQVFLNAIPLEQNKLLKAIYVFDMFVLVATDAFRLYRAKARFANIVDIKLAEFGRLDYFAHPDGCEQNTVDLVQRMLCIRKNLIALDCTKQQQAALAQQMQLCRRAFIRQRRFFAQQIDKAEAKKARL